MFDNSEKKFSNCEKKLSNDENESLYKKKISSKKKDKKRKRKIYKLVTFIFFEFQRQQTLKINSFNYSRQISFETINLRQRNISISQISATKFITRLRIIRYLYEKHSNVEFFYTVRNIYEAIIDYFNDLDLNNIESYIYRFSLSKSIEFINSISDIFNTSDSCNLFRLTTRTFSSFLKSNSSKSQLCSKKVSTR